MLRPDGHPVLAACLDLAMAPLARVRPRVIGQATGRVLEVGVGTGLNLAHYGPEVEQVVGVEPDPHMLRRAEPRAAAAPRPVALHPHGGEALPFPDDHFDTVVFAFVLCTIPHVEQAIGEAHRVLRPGGRVIWVEHTRSRHGLVHAVQRVVEPAWKQVAGGCHLTRAPVDLLEEAGLAVEAVRPCGSEWNPVPVYRGVAIKR